ncbi:Os08g0285301 [Oryza sativa Japonica Group]|jgi:hypothetical protein|uniref:Os08g0285301 protein n=2 Tax=Oryza sativa subsp. japonica TaxID=39947 RepID=B9G031_ORYSJ|nr:hypothetical protein OsJ_26744 [Oryza sativa Japonica Group]BAT04725.1 Os08g0285301 [Oryza sativa Japonica Group]
MLLIPSYSPRTTIVKNSLRNIGLRPLAWRLGGKTLAATAPPLPSPVLRCRWNSSPAKPGDALGWRRQGHPHRLHLAPARAWRRWRRDGEVAATARSWRRGRRGHSAVVGLSTVTTARRWGSPRLRRWATASPDPVAPLPNLARVSATGLVDAGAAQA